jgi:hypothetical protein
MPFGKLTSVSLTDDTFVIVIRVVASGISYAVIKRERRPDLDNLLISTPALIEISKLLRLFQLQRRAFRRYYKAHLSRGIRSSSNT